CRLPATINHRPPGSGVSPARRPRRAARGCARPAAPARSGTCSSVSAAPTIVSRSSSVSASTTAIIPASRARRAARVAAPARTSASGTHASGGAIDVARLRVHDGDLRGDRRGGPDRDGDGSLAREQRPRVAGGGEIVGHDREGHGAAYYSKG